MSNTITLPGGITLTLPQLPLPQQLNLPNINIPNLPVAPGAQGAPDLSGLITALTPVISAAVPQLAPFLPLIGVLFQVAHALSTQMQATAASGTPNPSLQLVHDAFWQQILGAFGQKPTPLPTPASG